MYYICLAITDVVDMAGYIVSSILRGVAHMMGFKKGPLEQHLDCWLVKVSFKVQSVIFQLYSVLRL